MATHHGGPAANHEETSALTEHAYGSGGERGLQQRWRRAPGSCEQCAARALPAEALGEPCWTLQRAAAAADACNWWPWSRSGTGTTAGPGWQYAGSRAGHAKDGSSLADPARWGSRAPFSADALASEPDCRLLLPLA